MAEVGDTGAPGYWAPRVLNNDALMDVRNIAGERPYANSKMVTINLFSGEVAWLQARAKIRPTPRRRSRK